MKKAPRIHNTWSIVCLSALLCYSLTSGANDFSKQKSTAVDRLHVAQFRIRSQNETLRAAQTQIQNAIVREFNQKSYWEAVALFNELPPKVSPADIANTPDTKEHSAVLLGEFGTKTLKIAIRRYPTAKLLGVWSFPLPKKLDRSTLPGVLRTMVDTIIADTPYKGFITTKRDDQVKINLGRRQTLKPGDTLEVFELEGENFESERRRVGQIKITRVSPEAAIAEIKSGDVELFNKVSLSNQGLNSVPSFQRRYFEELWIGPSGQLMFIDTRISADTDALRRRQYQLTLSPFFGASIGWNRVALSAMSGSATNASNKVDFLFAEAGYEVLNRGEGRIGLVTTLGGGYASYNSNTKPGATLPLDSTTIFYPFLEQTLNFGISNRARLFGAAQLQFPKISQDKSGTSEVSGSFGFKTDFGLRMNLSNRVSLQNGLTYQYSQWSVKGSQSIAEVLYGVNGQLFYRF